MKEWLSPSLDNKKTKSSKNDKIATYNSKSKFHPETEPQPKTYFRCKSGLIKSRIPRKFVSCAFFVKRKQK